jgi:hypothetical protein
MPQMGKCERVLTHPRIVLKEHQSCFVVVNPQRKAVRCVTVDGCMNIDGPRCDHLVIDPTNVEHFVELKGTDVRHAVCQLESSIRQLAVNLGDKRHAYVISTRSPLMSPKIQQLQLRFRKALNSTLTIKSMFFELKV